MRREDEGFTIVELIVALAVLSVAMAGLGVFFVDGTTAVSQQRDERQASQVAATALEQIRALEAKALLVGRGKDNVAAQWKYGTDTSPFRERLKPYLKSMQMEWSADAATTAGDDAAIPTKSKTVTVGGITFEQTIFVGGCEVYYMTTDACVDPASVAKRPADTTTILQYFRVVVMETWPHKSCSDTGGRCAYIASTLVSRTAEPIFDVKRPSPVVRDLTLNPVPVFYNGVTMANPFQFKATGGTLPNTWTFTGLPPGITGSKDGLLSGKATKVGTYSGGTAVVTDASSRSDTLSGITYRVVDPPTLTFASAPRSHVNEAVTIQPTAAGGDTTGTPKYTFTATGLPTGMAIDGTTGAITGKAPATYTATVRVTDVNGAYAETTYTHTVYPDLQLVKPADQKVNAGTAVNATVSASGGYGTYTYGATNLPTGVTINTSTGKITGTALIPGRYLPTVSVTDGLGLTKSDRFELVISTTTALAFSSPTSEMTSSVNQSVSVPITTNATTLGNKGTTITVVGLPPGLKYNSGKDTITGTPTTAGTYLVTLTAVSVTPAQTAITTFVWTIA
ncbi:putative Ig domain-containing protein [Actinoplanes subglobosus]|uniref:Ig domain-containing protein n=1 Tax=Actinoplanes subglobosus TaxID=1547892 RepID=A0ABV8IVD2_9ACTN